MTSTLISAEHVPEINRLTVLKSINQKAPFTRRDVLRRTGLSLPTVNSILATLKDEGYVTQIGDGRSRGGRPPTLYQFNPEARYAIGIQIQLWEIFIGLVDLQENVAGLVECPFSQDATSDHVIRTLEDGIKRIVSEQEVDVERLIGIGLGVPGFVERESGIWLRFPRTPDLRDVPLRTLLSERFGVPIYIQNEMNVRASAELRYGDLQTGDDALLIICCEGIKASVVADGRILSGLHGNFGSVGHFIVVENGRPCFCGSKGCLDMYASGNAFREAIESRMEQTTYAHNLLASSQPDEVFRLAAEGDVFCREIVEETIPYMSYAFASLIRLTDIEEVILLGAFAEGGDYLRNLLYENITRQLPEVSSKNLEVQIGSKQDTETVVAAAALPAIQGHFELQIS